MRTWFPGFLAGIILFLSGAISTAQFVAFNDHAPGTNTAVNTTTWNVNGDAPGRTGPLKEITTGLNLPITLTITVSGNMTGEGSQALPAAGTPLYQAFNGFVDFTGTPNPSLALNGAGAVVTYTLTGLDPNKRYSFKGSAVRGGGYADRWTLFELAGGDFYTSAHTAGALTTAQVASILANQVAVNTGANDSPTSGDMAFWDNIDPGADGTFAVSSYQYLGAVPGGSSAGVKGYAMTGFRLEEFNVTPVGVAITNNPPATATVGELQPLTLSVGARGNPRPTFQWYRNDLAIQDATNASYSIASTPLSDNGAVFKVIARNVTNGVINTATSSDCTVTVIADNTRPTLVRAASLAENSVLVTFSEPVSETTANNVANYALTGTNGTFVVFSAELQPVGSNVVLTTTVLPGGATYTVTVNGIRDRADASNQILANSKTNFSTAQGYTSVDIGSPGVVGSVTASENGFDVRGSGADIGGTSDQLTFGYQQRGGDFDVKVRLQGLSLADSWSKAGLMVRQSLSANSAFAAALATPSVSGLFFESRASAGGAATMTGNIPVNYPDTWLRLRRAGNVFTGYGSFDGVTWAPLGTATITMADPIYFGLAVSSHTNTVATVGQFRDIGVATGAINVTSLVPSTEPLGPSSRRTPFAISEVMYHPANGDEAEFVEIFNSQAFWENIGGYRLSGDINYTFPANTIIPAGAFVVVAKDPAYIQSVNPNVTVFGPFSGNLPNDNGTIRLRNPANAVLLEVNYSDNNPWPIAADGAGHSLVLAHASYGEGHSQAWAASARVGGSPGVAEAVAAPGKTVVINEVLAHTDDPDISDDYVELYNHSKEAVDLSGALIKDSGTNVFRIPNGTSIASNGFLVFNFRRETTGFAFNADGERVFLVSSNQTRVLDGVAFGAQADLSSWGRLPDGSDTWRELAARSPGLANRIAGFKSRDIVINELMYSPISGNANEEYIEIYNKGASSVDLGGWRFEDGIDFTFPSNTVVAPNGYLVVAKNATNLLARYGNLNAGNTVGDYGGTLGNAGERVALAKPELNITNGPAGPVTNIIYVVVNEVSYGDGGRWGVWADGGGSSLELVDPHSDNQQAANWADSDETAKSQWTNFEYTGGIGETLGTPINDNVQIFQLGIGEALVDDVEIHNGTGPNLITNPGFESGMSGWTPQGSHDLSSIEDVGFTGAKSLHMRAGSRGDVGANRVRSPVLAPAASGTITMRAKARWLRGWPEVLLRLHGGGAEVTGKLQVPTNLGTPGAANSRYRGNAGPAIYDVSHSPPLPVANEPVVVTAKVSDPDGISALRLRYRIDQGSTPFPPTMMDNGTGGDAIANDGIYSVTIPGQASTAIVAFYIEAVDSNNTTNLFPQDVFPKAGLARVFPNDAPSRECVIRWGEIQMPGSLATYHIWVTSGTANRWQTRDPLNNAQLDGTFVYNNYRVVYNMYPAFAGSPWHRSQMTSGGFGAQRCDYALDFPSDDPMLGANGFVVNNSGNPSNTTTSDLSAQAEQTSVIIFREIGLHYNYRRYIHVFVNGSQRSTSANVSGNFIFEDSQQPNADAIDEWFHDDTDGDFFKIEDWFEFPDNGYDFSSNNDADLTRRLIPGTTQLSTAPYRFMFRKRAVGPGESASDYASFFKIVDAASPPANPGGPIDFASLDAIVNWEQWMRIFAVQRAVGNWDSYGWERGKNDYLYKPVNGRFEQMPWDIDFTMGVGGRPASQDLFGAVSDPRVSAMRNEPLIMRAYWRGFYDIVNGPLNSAFLDPILDAKQAALRANNVTVDSGTLGTIKSYIAARRQFLLDQLAANSAPFAVSGNATFSTSNNLVVLTGTAPFEVNTINVNGTPYPVKWTTATTWNIFLAVGPGLNVLNIQGYDLRGKALPTSVATVNVTYTGPEVAPQEALVINEIMYNPAAPNAAYIEIFNSSTTVAFDLSGWRLSGVDYTFPPGTIISNRQFIVIAENRGAFTAAYGSGIPVLGIFEGNLDPEGEKLALIKPGATEELDQVIDAVRYEAAAPWPAAANGGGAAFQLVDPSQDDSRAANWSDGSGWRFHSFTAVPGAGATSFTITLGGAGDFYIDDISLVAGSTPASGPNLFQNGGFETGSLSPWTASGNHSGSAVSTAVRFSGNASLRIVATGAGSVPGSALAQAVSGVVAANTYTLSFWYLPSATPPDFNYRLTSNFRSLTSISLRPSLASPGTANTTAASIEAFPLVWINEIQPNNATGVLDNSGQRDPWIEIFNSSSNPITLDGYALATSYGNLGQWLFPNGTILNPGEFKLLFADAQPEQSLGNELHTNFRLDPTNGSIVLSKSGRILDYINYTNLNADFSYGSIPDGQVIDQQQFFYTTPGAPNNGAPVPVIINEWMASNTSGITNPANGRLDDWIELYNFGTVAVDLSGFFLTDDTGQKRQWSFPAGTVIGPGEYLFIWADNAAAPSTPTDLHANFALGRTGEKIALYTPVPRVLLVDLVTFGVQQNNISQGRYPDGNFAGVLYFMTNATPHGANVIPPNQSLPQLPALSNRNINEGTLLTFTNLATDADLPAQMLTYSLDSGAPAGASINSINGVFRWTPAESQGGAGYTITIRVSDNGSPAYTASRTFTVSVNKINSPPTLLPLPSRTLPENTSIAFAAEASDSDLPVQNLTFSLDAGAPEGAAIDPVTGQFSWTPTEAQGPATNVIVVRVTDDGNPSVSATQGVTIVVTEVNAAPALNNPGTQTIDETRLWTYRLSASDTDLPANNLTFATVAPFISGVTINAGTGVISWTPTEAQGPGTNTITVRVTDNASPSMSATQKFTVIINEINNAPVLNNLNNSTRTIAELTSITLTNRATDQDTNSGPLNVLTYELVSGPEGVVVNPTTGIFNWVPSEAQGPSSNSILVRVFDDGVPSLSATQRFTVLVTEVNVAPVFPPIPNKNVNIGQTLSFTNVVNDPDLPAQSLTFSLGAGAPSGATLGATSGIFSWTPPATGTNVVSIRVVDNGTPALSATQSVTIVVSSIIRITGTQLVSPTELSITFESQNGKDYELRYTDDLQVPTQNWAVVSGSQVRATASSQSIPVTISSAVTARFYRVVQTN